MQEVNRRAQKAYQDYTFHIVYHSLHNFCALDLSAFYLDIVKDRLYTSPGASTIRRSAQSAMAEILAVLVRLMAPIISFTTEEIWEQMESLDGADRPVSVHADVFLPVNEAALDPELAARWEDIMLVRRCVTKALEAARAEKLFGHSLDAAVTVALSAGLKERLEPYREQLRSIFIVSSVEPVDFDALEEGLLSEISSEVKVQVRAAEHPKCERCWVRDPDTGADQDHPSLCPRCLRALAEIEGS